MQDFAINFMVNVCGKAVPEDAIDLFSISNLPIKNGKTFNGARGSTALLSLARVKGQMEKTMFEDLPEEAKDWNTFKGLLRVPNHDPLNDEPYMRRVWSEYQRQLKAKREFPIWFLGFI